MELRLPETCHGNQAGESGHHSAWVGDPLPGCRCAYADIHRNADSVVRDPVDDKLYFVKPLEEEEPFEDFLASIVVQEKRRGIEENVKYAQTRR